MIADTVKEQNGAENVISKVKDLSDSKATKKGNIVNILFK